MPNNTTPALIAVRAKQGSRLLERGKVYHARANFTQQAHTVIPVFDVAIPKKGKTVWKRYVRTAFELCNPDRGYLLGDPDVLRVA